MEPVANRRPQLQMPDIMQMGVVVVNGVAFRKKPRLFTKAIIRSGVASANFNDAIQIDTGQTPFLLTSLHCSDTADADLLTSQEEFLASITDNESGYNWTDGLVPRSALFGYREFGFQFPMEIPIRSTTRIQIAIQNQAAGMVAGTAFISFRGWQLFPLL